MMKMSFKASFVLLLSALTLLSSHAKESPAELYWKTKLGDIPMPKVLMDSLKQGGKANSEHQFGYARPADQGFRDAIATYARPADQGFRRDAIATYARPADQSFRDAIATYARPADQSFRDAIATYARPADQGFRNAIATYARPADQGFRDAIATYAHPADQGFRDAIATYASPTDQHPADQGFRDAIATYASPTDQRPVDQGFRDAIATYAHPANKFEDAHPTTTDHQDNTMPKDGRVQYFTSDKLFLSGSKMKLHFRKIDDGVRFLPLHVAKTIDITPNKLQTILNILSVNPKSPAAHYIKHTLNECAEKGIKDELRLCVTSVESMVDYIALHMNYSEKNKIGVVTTEQEEDILMDYKIQKAEKLGKDDAESMICHKLENPYAVFLCHTIKSTKVYGVSLVSANGKQMKAVAVCHEDTSSWNPKHIAFQVLKIKPGTNPICHFLSGDVIVWLQN